MLLCYSGNVEGALLDDGSGMRLDAEVKFLLHFAVDYDTAGQLMDAVLVGLRASGLQVEK